MKRGRACRRRKWRMQSRRQIVARYQAQFYQTSQAKWSSVYISVRVIVPHELRVFKVLHERSAFISLLRDWVAECPYASVREKEFKKTVRHRVACLGKESLRCLVLNPGYTRKPLRRGYRHETQTLWNNRAQRRIIVQHLV